MIAPRPLSGGQFSARNRLYVCVSFRYYLNLCCFGGPFFRSAFLMSSSASPLVGLRVDNSEVSMKVRLSAHVVNSVRTTVIREKKELDDEMLRKNIPGVSI